jgi:hypothetical protein
MPVLTGKEGVVLAVSRIAFGIVKRIFKGSTRLARSIIFEVKRA